MSTEPAETLQSIAPPATGAARELDALTTSGIVLFDRPRAAPDEDAEDADDFAELIPLAALPVQLPATGTPPRCGTAWLPAAGAAACRPAPARRRQPDSHPARQGRPPPPGRHRRPCHRSPARCLPGRARVGTRPAVRHPHRRPAAALLRPGPAAAARRCRRHPRPAQPHPACHPAQRGDRAAARRRTTRRGAGPARPRRPAHHPGLPARRPAGPQPRAPCRSAPGRRRGPPPPAAASRPDMNETRISMVWGWPDQSGEGGSLRLRSVSRVRGGLPERQVPERQRLRGSVNDECRHASYSPLGGAAFIGSDFSGERVAGQEFTYLGEIKSGLDAECVENVRVGDVTA